MTISTSPFDSAFSVGNAIVHKRRDGRLDYANSYFIAADILARHASQDRTDREFLVLPVCYLYRHNLELQLKELIAVGQRIVGPINEGLNHHKIKRLWEIARRILRDADPGKDDPDEFRKLDDLIGSIDAIDNDGQAFRFATKTSGDQSLATVNSVDLQKLQESANSATLLLWGCIDWLNDLWRDGG